jgi:outer membrane usher protein
MRRKLWRELCALLGCSAGLVVLGGPGLAEESMTLGLGDIYATPSTRKSDRLGGVAGDGGSAPAKGIHVETVMGTIIPSSAPAWEPPDMRQGTIANPRPMAMPLATPRSDPLPRPQSTAAPPASPAAPTPNAAAESETKPGEILWSNKTAALPQTTSDASPAINTGGRAIELAVPLRDGTFYLGDVGARIAPDGKASIPKDRFVQITGTLLRSAALERLKAVPDSDGYLPLQALKEQGFDIAFDPAKVEMQFAPGVDQRATSKLSARRNETVRSETVAPPAALAGYVNMRAGVSYASEPFLGEEGTAGARIAFDGTMRWSDIVLESAASFEADEGFVRGASRLVYDMPEEALRFAAGDLSPRKVDLQGGADLLGLSVEKSYQKLQPGRNIRPTGSRSFRIERPSNIDVKVNGHTVQRLHLRPGDYDLGDLPLTVGANDISLVIEDDVGNRRTLDFTVFSGRALLAEGVSEWALSAGMASRYGGGRLPAFSNFYSDLDYDPSTPVVTGFYERGLTADMTGTVHFQGDPDTLMGGAGAALQTSVGFWALDAAASHSASQGVGYAAGIGYELVNSEGRDGIARSFRIAADYYSAAFAAVDVLEACNKSMLDLSAIYSQALPWNMAGSVSGTWSLGREAYGDRYGVDVSLTRPIGPAATAGISAGYQQGSGDTHEEADRFIAALRISYRVDDHASIDADHDIGEGRSHLGYRYQQGSGVGSWNAQLDVQRTGATGGREDDYGVSGALGYIGNRAELAVSQHNGLAGLDTERLDQRTSVTAGTALALADGRVAVGRPITNGFAIVAPHDNIPDSEVRIGASKEEPRGASDFLGPALVSEMSPYAPSRIAYDVDHLPVGYDLGAGGFDVLPAYRSGYRLTVGSDYTVTAFGTLVDAQGEPIALLTGTAREEGRQDGPEVTVFTNRTGRFGAQGLRPGRWTLDMATETSTRFILDVQPGSIGLVKLGTLRPEATR